MEVLVFKYVGINRKSHLEIKHPIYADHGKKALAFRDKERFGAFPRQQPVCSCSSLGLCSNKGEAEKPIVSELATQKVWCINLT